MANNLKTLFATAERRRLAVESSWDTQNAEYQQNVVAALTAYQDCVELSEGLSLFSPNETLEDIQTGDLEYKRS